MRDKIVFHNNRFKTEIKVYSLDNDFEVEFETLHDSCYLTIDQTKQLIEFLTKQIEGK